MNIYIFNLGDKVTGASLEAIFSAYGQTNNSNVLHESADGETKRFGWVQMPNRDEAVKAIRKLNGAIVDGRSIEVKEVRRTIPHLTPGTAPDGTSAPDQH